MKKTPAPKKKPSVPLVSAHTNGYTRAQPFDPEETSIILVKDLLSDVLKSAKEEISVRLVERIRGKFVVYEGLTALLTLAQMAFPRQQLSDPKDAIKVSSVEPPHPGRDALASQMISRVLLDSPDPNESQPGDAGKAKVRSRRRQPPHHQPAPSEGDPQIKHAMIERREIKQVSLRPTEELREEDRLRREILRKIKKQREAAERRRKEEEELARGKKKSFAFRGCGTKACNVDGSLVVMKRMKQLPDVFKLKGNWRQNKSEIIEYSPSNQPHNDMGERTQESEQEPSDPASNDAEFERKAAHYYEYMKQLRSIKVNAGVFLTVKREDEELTHEVTSLRDPPVLRKREEEEEEERNFSGIRRAPLKLPAIREKKALNKSYLGCRITRNVYRK